MSAVNFTQIEKDLRDLWNQMGKAVDSDSQHAVTRACVLNLIIYAPGERSEQQISEVVADVTADSPGRIVVLLPRPEAPSYLDAAVTAQCHLPSGGRKQICCEQILVRGHGESVEHMASIAIPLLVPDLPTFLWWRDTPEQSELFESLIEASDRVVIDSALFRMDPGKIFSEILKLMREYEWTTFSDLNWARLTPLRFAIAEFYDLQDCRVSFDSLDRIEIYSSDDFQLRARMLLGWLASRLNWRWKNQASEKLEMISAHGPISISLQRSSTTEIKFKQADAEFRVAMTPNGYVHSEVYLSGNKRNERIMPIPEESESKLVTKELSILGNDSVYEKMVEFFEKTPDMINL